MTGIVVHPIERLAAATLLFSASCQGLVFWLCLRERSLAGLQFAMELRVLLAISLAGSAAVFLVDNRRYFRVLQVLRAGLVLVMLRIVGSRSLAVEFLLLASLITETGIYERPGVSVTVSAAYVLFLVAFDAVQIVADAAAATRAVLILVGSTAVIGGIGLITAYRERIVENEATIRSLNATFQKLADVNLGLQVYATHAESDSAVKERNRITRELHDSIGYAMTNIAMMMSAGKVLMRENPSGLPELLDATRGLSEACLQETRKTLYRLRSIKNERSHGVRALAQLTKAFRAATGVDVEFHQGNLPWSLGEPIDAVIYRLVQEGLTNAFCHGKASRIRIIMWRDDDAVRVVIRDNGRGADAVQEGIGLSGMRERISSLGGRLDPRNSVHGFELRAEIPNSQEGPQDV